MSKILEGIGRWLRNLFGASREAELLERRRNLESEQKALADKRQQANRTASGLEDVIRQKLALSKSMTGTALTVISDDMNRLARDLRNVRDSLTDNDNRLAAANEEIHKIDLLLAGVNDMERAQNMERRVVEIEVHKETSAAVGDAFRAMVETSPVTSHTKAAGLNEGLAEFQAEAPRPALDPLILQLAGEPTPPAPAAPPAPGARRQPEAER